MPHMILGGRLEISHRLAKQLPRGVRRWGRAVLKTEDCWTRQDDSALLIEKVMVEFSQPLHPVAIVVIGAV